MAKKNDEFELIYFPLLMIFIFNIVTGTSKAFAFVDFMFNIFVVLLFNIAKLHRKCANSACLNVVMENLYLLLCFFGILNIWAAMPVGMPYIVV